MNQRTKEGLFYTGNERNVLFFQHRLSAVIKPKESLHGARILINCLGIFQSGNILEPQFICVQ